MVLEQEARNVIPSDLCGSSQSASNSTEINLKIPMRKDAKHLEQLTGENIMTRILYNRVEKMRFFFLESAIGFF